MWGCFMRKAKRFSILYLDNYCTSLYIVCFKEIFHCIGSTMSTILSAQVRSEELFILHGKQNRILKAIWLIIVPCEYFHSQSLLTTLIKNWYENMRNFQSLTLPLSIGSEFCLQCRVLFFRNLVRSVSQFDYSVVKVYFSVFHVWKRFWVPW